MRKSLKKIGVEDEKIKSKFHLQCDTSVSISTWIFTLSFVMDVNYCWRSETKDYVAKTIFQLQSHAIGKRFISGRWETMEISRNEIARYSDQSTEGNQFKLFNLFLPFNRTIKKRILDAENNRRNWRDNLLWNTIGKKCHGKNFEEKLCVSCNCWVNCWLNHKNNTHKKTRNSHFISFFYLFFLWRLVVVFLSIYFISHNMCFAHIVEF